MSKKAKNVPRATQQLEEIGRKFFLQRTAQKVKIQELATKTGVSSVTISNLEKGTLENCSLKILNKIGAALGLTVEIIISDQ